MEHAIDMAPMVDTAASLLSAMLLAGGLWVIRRALAWLQLSEDEKVRAYLETALQNAITFARNRVVAGGAEHAQIEVRNQVVAEATSYIVARVPDALKRFGIDEEAARDLVLARLPR